MDILEEITIARQKAEASLPQQEPPKQFPGQAPQYPTDKGLAWMMMTVPMVVGVVIGCSLLSIKMLDFDGAFGMPFLLVTIAVICAISFFVLRKATKISDKKLLKNFVLFSRKVKISPRPKHK